MIKSTLKIARCCPLVIQGFSNSLGLFQVIMANPNKFVTFCSATLPFCQALGFSHWGLLGSRVGYVQLTWEASFDVRGAKTSVVQICQVRRQVHLADVFDGGLFVIELGTKVLQTWNSSCNSGRPER